MILISLLTILFVQELATPIKHPKSHATWKHSQWTAMVKCASVLSILINNLVAYLIFVRSPKMQTIQTGNSINYSRAELWFKLKKAYASVQMLRNFQFWPQKLCWFIHLQSIIQRNKRLSCLRTFANHPTILTVHSICLATHILWVSNEKKAKSIFHFEYHLFHNKKYLLYICIYMYHINWIYSLFLSR